jgi:hypothetical protein
MHLIQQHQQKKVVAVVAGRLWRWWRIKDFPSS